MQRFTISRAFCAAMALVMWLTPVAALRAQQPAAATIDTRVAPAGAALGVFIRPKKILTSERMEMLPYEVIQAAVMQATGLDILKVEEAQFYLVPPGMTPQPQPAAIVKFEEPIDINSLKIPLEQFTQETVAGKTVYRAPSRQFPSLVMLDPQSLVVADEPLLSQILQQQTGETASVQLKLLARQDNDVALAVDFAKIRPLLQMAMQQIPQLPPQLEGVQEIPQLLKSFEASGKLSDELTLHAVLEAESAEAGQKLIDHLKKAQALYQQQMLAQADMMIAQSEDPVQQALGRYMKRMSKYQQERQEEPFTVNGANIELINLDATETADQQSQLVMVAVIGVLVALLLPAVQAAREAARRNSSRNNMKQLLLGLLNYEAANRKFPAQAIYDEDGKPLLSWRVQLLPYLDEAELFQQFKLDEPWDSEHNKKLISRMPAVFHDPSSILSAAQGRSSYVAATGKGLFMEGFEGTSMRQVRDGTSKTIAIVEVDDEHAPIWTRPVDVNIPQEFPAANLGKRHPGIFIAGYLDGHVSEIVQDYEPAALWKMFTIAGGEVVK